MESNIILYTTDTGNVSVQVQYEDGTFWLTQKRMAELFGVDVRTVNYHLKEIYNSKELREEATIRKIRIVQQEGKRNVERELDFYHLKVILAVGYRVNSNEATAFRQWATNTLDEFVTKGFVLDKERLKNGAEFGKDYFKDLLEQIREIRASERRFYQKITDIYALSTDYDKDAPQTEIVYYTADATQPHMGLTTWKHAPEGKILKSDVTVAKNYLSEKHIKALDRIVSAYLDLAEDRAEQELPTTMAQWARILDNFLTVAERPLLMDAGTISALEAKIKAESEYEVFRKIQDQQYVSDFDREVKRLKGE